MVIIIPIIPPIITEAIAKINFAFTISFLFVGNDKMYLFDFAISS